MLSLTDEEVLLDSNMCQTRYSNLEEFKNIVKISLGYDCLVDNYKKEKIKRCRKMARNRD